MFLWKVPLLWGLVPYVIRGTLCFGKGYLGYRVGTFKCSGGWYVYVWGMVPLCSGGRCLMLCEW